MSPEFPIRNKSKFLHEKDKYISSMTRVDTDQTKGIQLSEALRSTIRPKEERKVYIHRFAQEMKRQLDKHGDRRLDHPRERAIDFANRTLQDVEYMDKMEGNMVQKILQMVGVPNEFVSPEMTIAEIGELGVYKERLEKLSENLRPAVKLSMRDVPPDSLPAYVLERKLFSIQNKAERVSGSDLGDRHVAPLVLYADGVEVDKRTCEFLNQIRRKEPKLGSLMGRFFTSSDYGKIPNLFTE